MTILYRLSNQSSSGDPLVDLGRSRPCHQLNGNVRWDLWLLGNLWVWGTAAPNLSVLLCRSGPPTFIIGL